MAYVINPYSPLSDKVYIGRVFITRWQYSWRRTDEDLFFAFITNSGNTQPQKIQNGDENQGRSELHFGQYHGCSPVFTSALYGINFWLPIVT